MLMCPLSCCAKAWVSEQGRIDLQYIADRIRTPGEVNGKSANLNNALNHIFPPGTAISFNEVQHSPTSKTVDSLCQGHRLCCC